MNKTIALITVILVATLGFYLIKTSPFSSSKTAENTPLQQVSGSSISFDPAMINLTLGQQATVNIQLDPDKLSVAAVTISLSYDPTLLKIVSLKNGTMFTNILSSAKIQNGKATLSVATPPDSKGESLAGTVATVTVQSLSNKASNISFNTDTMAVALEQDGNILKNIGTLKVN